MLLNDSIVPEKQLIHLLQKYAKHSRTFHYIQESICSLITKNFFKMERMIQAQGVPRIQGII
ncbi:MAG: hypothetical protein Q8842_02345 [Candidatus Phytoplasma australasiaticum]|nr:hypothetical protein [Candidatus Phytoplasma australasiaticum]